MDNNEIWHKLSHLFQNDDGSLPDIFVENLSDIQIIDIYNWVVAQAGLSGEPTLWSITEERDIPIKDIVNPAEKFVKDEVEIFRHGLERLIVNGVILPTLTISVEVGGISFDYRKGKEWGNKEVNALIEFLIQIAQKAPNSKIIHAEEGSYENPSIEFSKMLHSIKNTK